MGKKLSLLLAGLCVSTMPLIAIASPKLVTNYQDLVTALKSGHRVNVVGDNSKCTLLSQDPVSQDQNDPDLSMVMGLSYSNSYFLIYKFGKHETVGVIATNTIAGSETGNAHRYRRIEVIDDNTAEIYVSRSDFASAKRTNYTWTKCSINNGTNNGGVSLFDYDAS